jgi:hypothetical protein
MYLSTYLRNRISIHLFVNTALILGKRRIYSKSVNREFCFGIQNLEILSVLTFHSCLRDNDSCLLCSSYRNKSLAQSHNQYALCFNHKITVQLHVNLTQNRAFQYNRRKHGLVLSEANS